MSQQHRNRLDDATSPYLQQHAGNPVEWWPWCDEALQSARSANRPILLSIGYSACHWCHVMAHESFEDAETAALMNSLFVNIKVDREERPDLDKIYQQAHQLLNQRPGGWPLTTFLSPDDLMPFFAGTYFPPTQRHGMISFRELLQRVDDAWRNQQRAIRQQSSSLAATLTQLHAADRESVVIDDSPLLQGLSQIAANFDHAEGGFGEAPKFPHPTIIEFLLRHHAAAPHDSEALGMALTTLRKMALGGIYDQLGGGFCRYSTDAQWMIPHFEKMLYDNGPLLALYADAWRISGDALFARVCEETAEWIMREMQSPEGGYYSTLDADSEGEEGRYYLWTPAEVGSLLPESAYRLFAALYGLDRNANFEGRWHLHAYAELQQLAAAEGVDLERAEQLVAAAKRVLLEARSRRIPPGRDDKILTSWNALMIKGMARAGRVFQQPRWIASAERALAFIRRGMWTKQRLLATSRDGHAHLNAYLDDYALLIDALLELLQARWRSADLDFAIALAEILLRHFEDGDQGGFFFTSDDHERLIHKPKPLGDDSMPSGNGMAALALQRLGYLLGEARYLEAAERTLKVAWESISQLPHAHCALLMALQEHLSPPEMHIARGDAAQLAAWLSRQAQRYRPARMTLAIADDADTTPALADKAPRSGGVIYRCRGSRCEAPVPLPPASSTGRPRGGN